MNRDEPAPIEDRYRGPASDEPPADTSRLSKEEWRYAAKVFAAWFLGGSVLVALVITWQDNFALSQFGGQEYLARVVTLDVGRRAPGVVIAAACNTLAMVAERRAKRAVMQVVQVPWSIVGFLGLATPLAMALIFGSSLAIITYWVGVPWADSWKGIQTSARWSEFPLSIMMTVVVSASIVAYTPQLMRILFRLRGWLILKFIVMSIGVWLLLSLVYSTASIILHWNEPLP